MMTHLEGSLRKLKSVWTSPVEYEIVLGEHLVPLNSLLGKKIRLRYDGLIFCIQCARKINKSFQQGYCFPCMQKLNECGNCAIFPEKCTVEQGTCPTDDWAHIQCHSDQVVYLANASGLKVGVTRSAHIPTRWIDQGAIQAMPIFTAKNRYRAGLLEVAFKAYVSDKTNWRSMLKNEVEFLDLVEESKRLLNQVTPIKKILTESEGLIESIEALEPITIEYPVLEYPKKIVSLSLDKQAEIQGILLGIKGQYLLLDCGVLNIRKFGGYHVSLDIE